MGGVGGSFIHFEKNDVQTGILLICTFKNLFGFLHIYDKTK